LSKWKLIKRKKRDSMESEKSAEFYFMYRQCTFLLLIDIKRFSRFLINFPFLIFMIIWNAFGGNFEEWWKHMAFWGYVTMARESMNYWNGWSTQQRKTSLKFETVIDKICVVIDW
jgi:hypothetical protein